MLMPLLACFDIVDVTISLRFHVTASASVAVLQAFRYDIRRWRAAGHAVDILRRHAYAILRCLRCPLLRLHACRLRGFILIFAGAIER